MSHSAHPSASAPSADAQTGAASGPQHAGAAPFLPGCGEGESLQLVLQKRIEQVDQGYTPAHDDTAPPNYLAKRAANYIAASIDVDTFGPKDPDGSKTVLRLVNAAALIFAQIDRVQREQKNRQQGENNEPST